MPSDSPVLNCFQPDVLTAGDTMLVISSRFNCLSTVPVPSVVTDFWLSMLPFCNACNVVLFSISSTLSLITVSPFFVFETKNGTNARVITKGRNFCSPSSHSY